jgi:hypothetical protein
MKTAPKPRHRPRHAELDLRVYLSAWFYCRFFGKAENADICEIGHGAKVGPEVLVRSLIRLRRDGFISFEFHDKTSNLLDLTFLKPMGGVS